MNLNIGCNNKAVENSSDNHIIPYVPVYTEIRLNIGGEGSDWTNQPKYIPVASDGKRLGYEGHGIILFTSDNAEYKCYDATCTNCLNHFEQKDLQTWIAKCPVCSTEFLLHYGYPADKELQIYPLKEYSVQKRGNKLIVSN